MNKIKYSFKNDIIEYHNGAKSEIKSILCEEPYTLFNYLASFDFNGILEGYDALKMIKENSIIEYNWWGCNLIYLESNSVISKIILDDELGGECCYIPNNDLFNLITDWIAFYKI